jgi:hypothetical protein
VYLRQRKVLTRQILILAIAKRVVRQDFYRTIYDLTGSFPLIVLFSNYSKIRDIWDFVTPSIESASQQIHSLMTELGQHRLASGLRRMIRSGSRLQVAILPTLAGALRSTASDLLTFLRAVLGYV